MERSGLESGVTHTGFRLKRRTGAAIRHHRDPGGRAGSAEEDEVLYMLRLRRLRHIQETASSRLLLAAEVGAQRGLWRGLLTSRW